MQIMPLKCLNNGAQELCFLFLFLLFFCFPHRKLYLKYLVGPKTSEMVLKYISRQINKSILLFRRWLELTNEGFTTIFN